MCGNGLARVFDGRRVQPLGRFRILCDFSFLSPKAHRPHSGIVALHFGQIGSKPDQVGLSGLVRAFIRIVCETAILVAGGYGAPDRHGDQHVVMSSAATRAARLSREHFPPVYRFISRRVEPAAAHCGR
jgi:hypothetical protein